MSEFVSEISSRIDRLKGDLARGTAGGDHFLVEVSLGELESLARIAVEHDLPLDGLDEAMATYSSRSAPSRSSSTPSTSTSGGRAATSSSPDGGPPAGPRTSTPHSVATSQAAAKSQGFSPRS